MRLTRRARTLMAAAASAACLVSLIGLARIVVKVSAWPDARPFVVVVASLAAAANVTALAVFLADMRRPPR